MKSKEQSLAVPEEEIPVIKEEPTPIHYEAYRNNQQPGEYVNQFYQDKKSSNGMYVVLLEDKDFEYWLIEHIWCETTPTTVYVIRHDGGCITCGVASEMKNVVCPPNGYVTIEASSPLTVIASRKSARGWVKK